jgi:integrase
VNGKQRRGSSGSRKKSEAQSLLKRRMGAHALGLEPGDEAKKLTFEDLARMIEEDYALQGRRSTPRLQLSLRRLREHFGEDSAVSITADRLTAYANARREEDAALASIATELAALRRAFNLAVRAGRLRSRPPFPTLRLNNRRQGFFEEDDFRAVLAELREHLKPLMTAGFLTGWRVEDLWRAMDEGRRFGVRQLLRFNGHFFHEAKALPLTREDLELLLEAAKADWRDVEPSVFGTLVRALDAEERHRLGAEFTP